MPTPARTAKLTRAEPAERAPAKAAPTAAKRGNGKAAATRAAAPVSPRPSVEDLFGERVIAVHGAREHNLKNV
ncbi:MAG: hypothetical protein KGQ28_10170, partial [Hyphomicrobiales bacterium]|nr:hypothetical protein [Hyphomicrobiales bacterium]